MTSDTRELQTALDAASAAGEVLMRHFGGQAHSWEKSPDNPLTQADLDADRAIALAIRSVFPDDTILSEETVADPARTSRQRVWIVDPMDGTKEFVAGIPEFCASVALSVDGEPVVAAIVNPAAGRAVWAAHGAGTFSAAWPWSSTADGPAGGRRAHVTPTDRLDHARVIASRTEISRGSFDSYEGWFAEQRPVGSIAWKLACVACGDADLNISVAPKNEWDVCAGDLLVREAGGVYVDFAGKRRTYNQPETLIEAGMAAGNAALVAAFAARERTR